MKKEIMRTQLNDLGDELVKAINNREDPFSEITVVVPSLKTEQWFKAYWLKTQSNVLMNVEFKCIDDALLYLIKTNRQYKLISKNELKLLIMKCLSNGALTSAPDGIKNYIYDKDGSINGIRLYDLSEKLSQLFIEYDIELVEGSNMLAWEKELYDLVISDAKKHNIGTLRSIFDESKETKESARVLYLFGFSCFTNVQKWIINEYCKNNDVIQYLLEIDAKFDAKQIPISAAPSKLREVEHLHGDICKLLGNMEIDEEGKEKPINKYSDFLVLAPDISVYESTIARVFKQVEMRDGRYFPDIPYYICSGDGGESDIAQGLRKLFEIYGKGFYTRLDFIELVRNKTIQSARGILPEYVDTWVNAITRMNIFRDKESGDEWDYAEKRILLSKIANINDIGDETIELMGKEYIPYSYIGFDDDAIEKFVEVIEDVRSWINCSRSCDCVTRIQLNAVRNELDKWFSMSNDSGEERNGRYKKVLGTIDKWEMFDMPDDIIPLKTLYYVIKDAEKVSHNNGMNMFTNGITFASIDEVSSLSSKYIFLIGMGSTEFPAKYVQNEIDKRLNVADDKLARIKEGLLLQCQNGGHVEISYVNKDLQTDEDFYPSTMLSWWDENAEIKISLDEDREWESLFTMREYNNKKYYQDLKKPYDKIQYETENTKHDKGGVVDNQEEKAAMDKSGEDFDRPTLLTTRDLSDFLEEPLKYKAGKLFGYDDDSEDSLHDEYEPFVIDNRIHAELLKKMIINEYCGDKVSDDALLADFEKKHKLPDITEEIKDRAFMDLKEQVDVFKEAVQVRMENPKITAIKDHMFTWNNHRWTLTCNDTVLKDINGNEVSYFRCGKLEKDNNDKSYLRLYIGSLLDIAGMEEDKEYKVKLLIKKTPQSVREYTTNPEKAREILNELYAMATDSKTAAAMPIEYIRDDKLHTYDDLLETVYGYKGCWGYFSDKEMFDKETQLGYTRDSFEAALINYRAKMKKLILFDKVEKGK